MNRSRLLVGILGATILSLILAQTTYAGFVQGTRVKTECTSPFHISTSPDGNTLFVVNQSGHSVTFIDAKSQKVVGEVAVEVQPEYAACTPDGKTLYVANAESDSVSVVDIASKAVTKTIKVGDWPCSVKLTADGKKAYVCCSGSLWDKIDIIDTTRNEKVGEITLPDYGPRDIAISPDGKQGAVILDTTGEINRSIVFIDTATNKITEHKRVRHSSNLRAVVYSPDGRYVLVTEEKAKNWLPVCIAENGEVFTNNIIVAETKPGGKIAQLPLDELNNYDGNPYGLVIDKNGKYVYIGVRGMHRVTILDFDKMRQIVEGNSQEQLDLLADDLSLVNSYLVKRVPVGLGPSSVALSPDGKFCYAANYFSNNVSIVRTPAD